MSKYLTPVLILAVAVLAVALFIKGGEVITAYQVQTVNQTAPTLNITSIAPTMENVLCYDYNGDLLTQMAGANELALKGGTTARVICNGTGADDNGAWEINGTVSGSIDGRVYDSTKTSACTADSTDCYVNSSCEVLGVKNATAQYFECTFDLWYHADNTSDSGDWYGWMNVSDTTSNGGDGQDNDTFDVDELLAVGVPGVLSFGSHAPGDTLVTGKGHDVTNYGNVRIDLQINGTDPGMTCDSATNIDTSDIKYNCTDNMTSVYGGTSLQTSPISTNCTSFDLVETSNTASPPSTSSSTTYWGLDIPLGVYGDCEGTIWFTAILG